MTVRVSSGIDSQVFELAQRIDKPASLVASVVADEERAGRVVRAEDGTLALAAASLSPEVCEALRRLDAMH